MKRLKHQLGTGLFLVAVAGCAKAMDISTRMEFVEIRSTQNANRIIALESNLNLLRNASASKAAALESALEALKAQLALLPVKHQVGERYHGGLVFQVDESGQHGLIAALKDASDEGLTWRNGAAGNKTTNARADGIDAGETNTRLIVASQTIDNQKGQFAALAAMTFKVAGDGLSPCAEKGEDCYGNWYLPSALELRLLHQTLVTTGALSMTGETYWSSTELSVASAYQLDMATGALRIGLKADSTAHVRPISRF
ncbi:DUF1566 domain-containing protein [Legionella tunisiensis]|uniref:DUF1566 domain-containing protein n=1 Tax=Legionella tunisiensis TaxID=1034944 RepID=UPI0003133CB1|nr:DUF1566 domain-containing protein [Legionella tunisiensis]